jgi:hypothetical protein
LRAADESPILRPAFERSAESEIKSLPAAPHAISRATAEKLAAAVPKTPTGADPKPATVLESIDVRDLDKPRNGIIRLPSFIVGELKLRVPAEQDVLTPKGRLDLALKRQPGLKFGPLAYLNDPIALDMLAEEERLDRLAKIGELSGFLSFAQQPPTDGTRRLIQQTYLRTSDWLVMGGSYQLSSLSR